MAVMTSESPHLCVYDVNTGNSASSDPLVAALASAAKGISGVPSHLIEGESQQGGKETGDAALVKQSKKHEVDRRLNDKGWARAT